jgi:predicted GIY-YIG superfamily endonuclease
MICASDPRAVHVSPTPAWWLEFAQSAPLTLPAIRPLRLVPTSELFAQFARALRAADGATGAHCIHELWMRRDLSVNIDEILERLWKSAARSIPHWLPMRDIDWLPLAYEVSAQFRADGGGRTNIYFVLLDYSDSRNERHAVYVGMSRYSPERRFDQHKAGIRAARSVLRRGLEVLTGPTLHLQHIKRRDAVRIEVELAEALRAAGLFVQGGH